MKNLHPRLIFRRRQLLILLLVTSCAVIVAARAVVSSALPADEVSRGAAPNEAFRLLLTYPAPTPRVLEAGKEEAAQKERPSDFYDDDKPPPNDAPLEDLVDYWERQAINSGAKNPKLSDEVRERLFAACEDEPGKLSNLLSLLPETAEAAERVKKLYDAAQGSETLDDDWRKTVRDWLKFNSKYFLDDLIAQARKARDKDSSVENNEALAALLKVDPDTAEPLLRALAGGIQPRIAAVSLALLYQNARAMKDSVEEERYRARLQAIATDDNAPGHARDTAIQTLTSAEWQGRDDWYLSLFEDETLLGMRDGSSGFSPLTYLFAQDPEKWIPVMARLVEQKNQKIKNMAATCLISFQNSTARKDALIPLLPWLTNPDWAKDEADHRLRLIQSMDF
ncbi:MAG TPA: hypothetical protein VF766_00485, partial [Pyrinomonadaceae bacterium]